MVGRLTLDQVVKVRVLAPQLSNAAGQMENYAPQPETNRIAVTGWSSAKFPA
jgi:hypothetical protein